MATDKTMIREIIRLLAKDNPDPRTELDFASPFQLLVAVILSAQCTDKRVNLVTMNLFKRYQDAEDFACAAQEDLEREIYSTGFYKNKAKNIIAASRMIIDDFGGRVPENMDDLVRLPGVARKTANVVLSEAFGRQEGIAVDTHVIRLSRILGINDSADPKSIEKCLMDLTPRQDWGRLSNLLILHGRHICKARKPACEKCVIMDMCPSKRTC